MTTTTAEQRDEARFQEQVARSYHEWLAYLAAQLTLLDIQADQTRVAFERVDAHEDAEREARARLAGMDVTQRALFDAVYEQERQEVQHQLEQASREAGQPFRHIDPDEVGRLALSNLQNDAKGIGTEQSRGLMPRGKPEEIKWYRVDVAALAAAPSAAAYAVGGDAAGDRTRVIRTVGMGVAAILLVLVWMFLPRGMAQQASPTSLSVTANGATIDPWSIPTLMLTNGDALVQVLPVEPVTSTLWPSIDEAPAHAFWQSGSLMPLRICVPEGALTHATVLHLPGVGDLPTRVFALGERGVDVADLVVEPCERGSKTPARYGSLRETIPPPTFAVGETAALSADEAVTVTAFTLIGSGEDPSLPVNQSRVSIAVATPHAQDWPALAPTLLLPNGMRLLAGEILDTERGVELRYLIPQPIHPLDVVWSLTPDAMRASVRWRTTLEPPPARDGVLRAALAVRAVTAARGASPGTYDVQLTIANRSSLPLLLVPDDISLSAQNRPLAVPDLGALRRPLAPAEERTLELVVPAHNQLILRIGTAQYAIREP